MAVRDEDYKVSGRADTLTRAAEGPEIEEYKTIDSSAFRYGDLPYQSHVTQLTTYLAVYPGSGPFLFPPPPIRRGRLIYVGKQDGKIREFVIEITDELAESIKADLLRLESILARFRGEGILPDPLDVPKTDYRIRFCDYKGTGLCCGDDEWRTARTDATEPSTTPSTTSSSDASSLAVPTRPGWDDSATGDTRPDGSDADGTKSTADDTQEDMNERGAEAQNHRGHQQRRRDSVSVRKRRRPDVRNRRTRKGSEHRSAGERLLQQRLLDLAS